MVQEPKMGRYIALFFAIWIIGGAVVAFALTQLGVAGARGFAAVLMFAVGFVVSITPYGRAQIRYHAHDHDGGHDAHHDDDAGHQAPVAVPGADAVAVAAVAATSTTRMSQTPDQETDPDELGWLPDPTRRHELRFRGMDGWTKLVKDGNFSSSDPFDPSEVMGR